MLSGALIIAAGVPQAFAGQYLTVTIGYLSDGDVTVIDLPYSGGAFTMTIALPHDPGGIGSLVLGLTGEQWTRWTAALDSTAREIYLPKFTGTICGIVAVPGTSTPALVGSGTQQKFNVSQRRRWRPSVRGTRR